MTKPLTINGWTILAHPQFLSQIENLTRAVEIARQKNPEGYRTTADAKLLKAIHEIAWRRIPADPTLQRYRLGNTLGAEHRHWFREKFGNGRFRLFFRYDGTAKIIVYAWVNDETTLRTYGARSDAYAVFAKMLNAGNPPDAWDRLVAECKDHKNTDRLSRLQGPSD